MDQDLKLCRINRVFFPFDPYYGSDALPSDWMALLTNKTHIEDKIDVSSRKVKLEV
jgi:hypothetical protein